MRNYVLGYIPGFSFVL